MAYQNFYTTKLYTDVSAADTTITLETPPTATSGRLVLEARNVSKREVIKYTGVSGNQVTGVLRGQGGTTAQTHLANTLVEMNLTAEDLEDAINVPNDIVTRFDESLGDFIASGLVWSQTALLVGEMTAGVVYIDGERLVIGALSGINFTASKDTYVDIATNGSVSYDAVANGASAPALAGSHVRIAKVVTNGSGITSVVQTGVDSLGNTISPSGSVGPTQLSTSAILLDYSEKTASQNFTSEVLITGLSITFTVPTGGRRVEIDLQGYVSNSAAGTQTIRLRATDLAGTQLNSRPSFIGLSTASESACLKYSKVYSPGTYTVVATAQAASCTGTWQGAPTSPSYITAKLI